MVNFNINKQPSDISNNLATRLKQIRKQKKISQQELAERSGVSLGSLKRFEQKGLISLEALLRLAQILDRLDDFDNLLKVDEDLSAIEKLFSDKTR